jgi:hypothetical protein
MNHSFINSIDEMNKKIDLTNCCTCQLKEFALAIEHIESANKEQFLAFLYLESLLQGIIFCHDQINYWSYLELIGDRKVVMQWHGSAEVQFQAMLTISSVSTFKTTEVHRATHVIAEKYFPEWIKTYEEKFGYAASIRLKNGVKTDVDIRKLLETFPFLKGPIETTFGTLEDE